MERTASKSRRFAFERRSNKPYMVPEGTFESAMMVIKEVYPRQTTGVGDSDKWSEFEEKAKMTPRKACFQYFLAGVGHETLARRLLNSLESFVGSDLRPSDKEQIVENVARRLYQHYPPKYKKQVSL